MNPKKFNIIFGPAEVTHLGAIGYGVEVRADVAPMWHRARRQDLWRRAQMCNNKTRLT
jgi:hypothetical protein